MTQPEILTKYQETLEGTLGAIAAHLVCTSKDSSKVIRDCSKQLDSMSVELRKTLVDLDKTLGVQNEQSN
jgi:hypothetical protein